MPSLPSELCHCPNARPRLRPKDRTAEAVGQDKENQPPRARQPIGGILSTTTYSLLIPIDQPIAQTIHPVGRLGTTTIFGLRHRVNTIKHEHDERQALRR